MLQPARLTTPCVWSPNRWLEQINVEPGAPAHGAGAALQARLRLGGEHAPHSRRAPPSHKLPSCKVAQLNACTALVLVNRRSYGGRSVTHAKISVLIAGTRWIVVDDRPLMRRIVNIAHTTVVGRQQSGDSHPEDPGRVPTQVRFGSLRSTTTDYFQEID